MDPPSKEIAYMRQFVVSYNNSFRIMHGLSMMCSALACLHTIRSMHDPDYACYSLRCRMDVSGNYITHSVINIDVYVKSKLQSIWTATFYNRAILLVDADVYKA